MINYQGEKIVIPVTPIGFTQENIKDKNNNPALRVEFTVESFDMRYRMDGEDPTSTEGTLACKNDRIVIEGESNIQKFMAISIGVGRLAIIQPLFFREF
jgi:hypothetical protein